MKNTGWVVMVLVVGWVLLGVLTGRYSDSKPSRTFKPPPTEWLDEFIRRPDGENETVIRLIHGTREDNASARRQRIIENMRKHRR